MDTLDDHQRYLHISHNLPLTVSTRTRHFLDVILESRPTVTKMVTQSYLKRKPKTVQDVYTPPMSTSLHSPSLEDIESYFSKPYIPLSSLPTPPLYTSTSSRRTSRQASPDLFYPGPDELLSAELLGKHTSSLLPRRFPRFSNGVLKIGIAGLEDQGYQANSN